MSMFLESKKLKRTGFLPAMLIGGGLSALIPVMNMAVRTETFTSTQDAPLDILFGANYQMMSMLNVLLMVEGSCIMYHTEFADNAMQKMKTLPLKESRLFFRKMILLFFVMLLVFAMEAAAMAVCTTIWFTIDGSFTLTLLKNFAYVCLLAMPAMTLSLVIASAFQNMWTALGISVVCMFTAMVLPMNSFIVTLFPYSLTYQMLIHTDASVITKYCIAAVAEVGIACLLEIILIKGSNLVNSQEVF